MARKATPELPEGLDQASCSGFLLSFRDALDVVGGKWKSVILLTLGISGPMRFGELQRMQKGISAKTLSKELKDLEVNGLVDRSVLDTMPVSVIYAITPYGRSLEEVLKQLQHWGVEHREHIMRSGPVKKRGQRVPKPSKMVVVG